MPLHLLIFGIAALLFVERIMPRFGDDPGVGWHLLTGRIISEQGIPTHDPFLAISPPLRWISDQWLSDLILWSGYAIGGWPLLYLGLLILFFVLFVTLQFNLTKAKTVSSMAAMAATVICLRLAEIHAILRPVLFSFLLFWVTYTIVITKRGIVALPIIMLLWANIHPSFPLGLVLIGSLIITPLLNWFIHGEEIPSLKQPFVIFAAACMATLINPNGIYLWESIISLLSSSYFMGLNVEWQPIVLREFAGKIFFGILGVTACGYMRSGVKSSDTHHLLLFIIFAFLTLGSVRYAPLFAIVSAIPFATALHSLFSVAFFARPGLNKIRSLWQRLEKHERYSANIGTTVIPIILLVVAIAFYPKEELGPSPDSYPYTALTLVQTKFQTATILTTPDWGGFITWVGYPKIKATIDDRNGMLGEERYKALLEKFAITNKDHMQYLEKTPHDLMLFPTTWPIAAHLAVLHPDKIIFRDDKAVLFAKIVG